MDCQRDANRAANFLILRSPRIDSKEPIPPAHVARRASTTTLFQLGSQPPKFQHSSASTVHCTVQPQSTVERLLILFSSRPNLDSPTPSPAGACVPPLFPGGIHSLARRGGGSQFGRGDRHYGSIGIYVLCGLYLNYVKSSTPSPPGP